MLGAAFGVPRQRVATRSPHLFLKRIANIALILNLRQSQQPCGRTGIAWKDDQLAVRRSGSGPLEIMWRLRRPAVLIGAEESHVEVVTRIGEVVVVAAEERDLLFDRKDQSNVSVLPETIQPVLPAVVQRDDLALQAGVPDRL